MNDNGNGHKPALAFKAPAGLPIIGQPFTIKAWFPTVMLVCNCEGKEPVMVPRGGAAPCPACKKLYSIQQVAMTPDGNVNFGIGVMTPEDAAEASKGLLRG